MHFHLPKPLHGWREFAGEVGIIVIGVLIALGAESLLEDWRWNDQVERSAGAFKLELKLAAGYSYERLTIRHCLQTRLSEIADRLAKSDRRWSGMPEVFHGAGTYYSTVLPVVYRPPNRTLLSDAWRNALANGTINHIDRKRAAILSAAYTAVDEYMRLEREEGDVATRLGPLGIDGSMDARSKNEMLQTVALLDRLNDRMISSSQELIDTIRQAGLGYTSADEREIRTEIVRVQRDYRGACVAAPPLVLGAR
jgi:hypothetical protein